MAKRLILVAVLATTFLTSTLPVRADGLPGAVYVDTNYTGTEDGTPTHPYNTRQEGIAFAQAQPGGAWLYTRQADGSWNGGEFIRPTLPGVTGTPLADVALYILLVALALSLLLIGWLLRRRSQQLRGKDKATTTVR
jgi:hypothetical protein